MPGNLRSVEDISIFLSSPDNSVKLGRIDTGKMGISGSLFVYVFLTILMFLQPQIDIIIICSPLVYDNNLT